MRRKVSPCEMNALHDRIERTLTVGKWQAYSTEVPDIGLGQPLVAGVLHKKMLDSQQRSFPHRKPDLPASSAQIDWHDPGASPKRMLVV